MSQLIINSFQEAMEKEVVRAAFGQSMKDLCDPSAEVFFDQNMIVKIDAKIPGSSNTESNIADRILLAARKLVKNGVDFCNKEDYLAMTPDSYDSLFSCVIRMINNYVHLANMENGCITHFAGFKIIVSDYLPGGRKQTCACDAQGKEDSSKPIIPLPKSADPTKKEEVKSLALFWEKPALETAIWNGLELISQERPDMCFIDFIYGTMQLGCTRTEESRIGYIEMPA
ncbi:hypothetical protein H0G72_04520 [Liberibacter sp. Z1]|nr:hypothetical protein [Candidatus Liberibacter sp.]